uniref:Uncharacterized protein n=1 Tax=Anopheles maculatus TaxID=74869 RepID=A0A182TA00_9DIPT
MCAKVLNLASQVARAERKRSRVVEQSTQTAPARKESASATTQTTEPKKGSKGPSGQKPAKEVGQKKPKKVQPSVEPPTSGEEGWTVVGRKKKPAKDGANRQQKPEKDLPQARGSGKGAEKGKKDARPPKRFAGRSKRCAIIKPGQAGEGSHVRGDPSASALG